MDHFLYFQLNIYYLVFALFFSTETERRLKQENAMYESEMPELERKERLMSDVIENLQQRDNRIYEEIFHTSAPDMDPLASLELQLAGIDSVPDGNIVRYAERKLERMEVGAARIEDNFRRIMEAVQDKDFVMPPMTNPLKEYAFAQTGASVGDKINPFYKVSMRHNGIDMIAPSGEPVHAAADGTVKEVIRSRKGLGNVVVIEYGSKTPWS